MELVEAPALGASLCGAIPCRERIRPGDEVVQQARCTIGAVAPCKEGQEEGREEEEETLKWASAEFPKEKNKRRKEGTSTRQPHGILNDAGATEETLDLFFGCGEHVLDAGPSRFPLFRHVAGSALLQRIASCFE